MDITAERQAWRLRRETASTVSGLVRNGALLGLLLATSACSMLERQNEQIGDLDQQVDALETELNDLQKSVGELHEADTASQEASDDMAELLRAVAADVQQLPGALSDMCGPKAPTAPVCEQRTRTVVVNDGKMVVGELEHVWLDPPGITAIARVDTGATSSSLHAFDIVEFERDGEDWVRFDIGLEDDPTILERKVQRRVRVYQQADPDGTRRPVVRLRVRLGDVQDTFEFTLADRAHLDHQLLLGRNFLTDIAVVDVARQFVQPRHEPDSP